MAKVLEFTSKKKNGRPPIPYDKDIAERVRELAQYGVTQEDISRFVGIAPKTLRALYRVELDEGTFLAELAIRKKIYELCLDGDVTMLIFYAKTQLGWSEKKKESESDQSVERLKSAIRGALHSVGN